MPKLPVIVLSNCWLKKPCAHMFGRSTYRRTNIYLMFTVCRLQLLPIQWGCKMYRAFVYAAAKAGKVGVNH